MNRVTVKISPHLLGNVVPGVTDGTTHTISNRYILLNRIVVLSLQFILSPTNRKEELVGPPVQGSSASSAVTSPEGSPDDWFLSVVIQRSPSGGVQLLTWFLSNVPSSGEAVPLYSVGRYGYSLLLGGEVEGLADEGCWLVTVQEETPDPGADHQTVFTTDTRLLSVGDRHTSLSPGQVLGLQTILTFFLGVSTYDEP